MLATPYLFRTNDFQVGDLVEGLWYYDRITKLCGFVQPDKEQPYGEFDRCLCVKILDTPGHDVRYLLKESLRHVKTVT